MLDSVSVEGLTGAKFRRNYSAPPDPSGGPSLCEVARPNNDSENDSIEPLLNAF